MSLWHHLVRLCGIAIFLIVMQLAPTAAQAHEGHQARVSAVGAGVSAADAKAEPQAAAVKPAGEEEAFVEPANGVSDERPCNGGCCSGGTPCCASGIETQQQIMGWAGCSAPGPLGATPVLAGLQPEAIRRPPRSID